MIVGYFIEYTRGADYFIITTGILILIVKILDTIDLFQNHAVSDPSYKYKLNKYSEGREVTIGFQYMYRFI
jgi:hypothetical protein